VPVFTIIISNAAHLIRKLKNDRISCQDQDKGLSDQRI
jgi:hypothetical protein